MDDHFRFKATMVTWGSILRKPHLKNLMARLQPTALNKVCSFSGIARTKEHIIMSDHGVPQGIHG
jgi:hypothetical protein